MNTLPRTLATLILFLLSLPIFAASFGDPNGINWQPWNKASFAKAKAENKLLLINVGMEGCTACNRMERVTYANKDVISLINQHFVAIAVDAQARPDIGERYSDWAWPATAFLAPDTTQVFAMAGNRLPRNFIPILEDLLAKQQAGKLSADPNSPYAAPNSAAETELTKLRDQVRLQLDRNLRDEFPGWGRWGLNTEEDGPRLEHLYFKAHLYNNSQLEQLAINTSQAFLDTLDPVWGGAYVQKIPESVSQVPEKFAKLMAIPEKRSSNQSNAILAFALGYQLTKDKAFLEGMKNVDGYLHNWMQHSSGAFYANQKDRPEGLPKNWWPQEYWLLDSHKERSRYGLPPTDHAIYTDKNAELVRAYTKAWLAFKDPNYLLTASVLANWLLEQRQQSAGWLVQSQQHSAMQQDQRVHPHSEAVRPFLRPQVNMGSALLELYQATGEKRWLEHATRIADGTLDTLYDSRLGGFYATEPDETAEFIAPRKPLEDNAQAALFFYDLAVLTKAPRFQGIAEKTIKAVASNQVLEREGRLTGRTALALEKLTAAYVEFSVVTDKPNPAAQALYKTSLESYHPRKLVHFEAPGRYPQVGDASLFICNPDRCSLPLTKPEQVADVVESYRAGATSL